MDPHHRSKWSWCSCKPHSLWPLLRFRHSHVRVEIDAYADLTRHRPIRLNVNDPCRKTIFSGWLPAHSFGNFDEYLHKLAHVWRDVPRKVGSQHGDIYCSARPFWTGLGGRSKSQWNLDARAWNDTALSLPQGVLQAAQQRRTPCWDCPLFRKTGSCKNLSYAMLLRK
jgi:hypothetical protein